MPAKNESSSSSSSWVIWAAIVADAGVAAAKFVAAAFTGSSSMLAEGIHSTIDTVNAGLLLLGEHRGCRPPDELHPLGHGREVYFWAMIVAIVIFALGGGMGIYEGITHLLHPEPLTSPIWNYAVLATSAVFCAGSFYVSGKEFVRQMRPDEGWWQAYARSKDPGLYTIVFEDAAALVGLLLAFLGVWLSHALQRPWIDGVASLLIGATMALVAALLVNETRKLLLGESADQAMVRDLRRIVEADAGVVGVDRPLTMQLGPRQVLLLMEVEFPQSFGVAEVEATIDRLERAVRDAHPIVTRIYVEVQTIERRSTRARATAD